VGIEAVSVDVVMDGDWAKVVEPETGRCLLSVRLLAPGKEVSGTRPVRDLAPPVLANFDYPFGVGLISLKLRSVPARRRS
jgi:hypothetical protein